MVRARILEMLQPRLTPWERPVRYDLSQVEHQLSIVMNQSA